MTLDDIDTLYKQYFRQLSLYALHYMGDIDESKDVVQECFAAVVRNKPEVSNPKVYLYSAVRNRCIDTLRSKKKELTAPMDDLSEISDEEAQRRAEIEVRLWKAVDALPPKRRELLLLNKRDGLTYGDIARLRGLSENTVRNQIFRAIKALRKDSSDILAFLFCL